MPTRMIAKSSSTTEGDDDGIAMQHADSSSNNNNMMVLTKSSSTETDSDGGSSDGDSGESDDSESSTQSSHNAAGIQPRPSSQQLANNNNTTTASTTKLSSSERASLAITLASKLPPNISSINELSDYEILRLKNIQRNEAKLAALGLFGITSKQPTDNNNTNGRNGGASANKNNTSAKKAADTRQRNKARAKLMIENHEKWERSQGIFSKTTTPSDYNNNNNNNGTGGIKRSQPSRSAKSNQSISYTQSPTPTKRIQTFHTRLSELQQYYSIHKHYTISRTQDSNRYKSLYDWFNRIKLQYTKYRNEERSTLDKERVELLESKLVGTWWMKKQQNNNNGNSRGSGGGRNRKRRQADIVTQMRRRSQSSRGKDINIARKLWQSTTTQSEDEEEDETDESSSILDRIQREVRSDSEEEGVEIIGSFDSYSDESVDHHEDEERYDDYDRRRDDRKGGRMSELEYESQDSYKVGSQKRKQQSYYNNNERGTSKLVQKKSSSPIIKNRSSLEQVAPEMESEHIATRRSPLHKQRRRRRRSRSANNDDIDLEEVMDIRQQYTSQSRRRGKHSTSASRKRSMHHHSPSDEGSFVSEMSEQEVHHEHRERKRMRRRNDHQSHQHDTHHSHSSRRKLRHEKPMNEIIISSPSSQQYHLKQQNQYNNRQLERDVLLAEYGKLYGRQCSIYERKSRLELELRAIQKFMLADSNSSGNSDRLLAGDMSMAGSTNLLLAGGTSTTNLGSGTNTMMLMG